MKHSKTDHTSRHIVTWIIIALIFFGFAYAIRSMLLPFILGILIAYFLNPLTLWMQRKKIPRAAAAGIIISLFIGICSAAFIKLIPVLYHQAAALFNVLPSYVDSLYQAYFPQFQELAHKFSVQPSFSAKDAAEKFSPQVSHILRSVISSILGSGMAIINLGSLLVLTPVVAFYILKDWVVIVAKVDDLLPRRYAPVIREQISLIDQTIAGFVRGQINVCLMIAVFYTIALSIAGLNFAFAIGILSGFMLIIPFAGMVISAGVALAVMWFQTQSMGDIITVSSIYGLGMLIEGYLLTPKLVGEKVGLHPVWIIFGMLAGGTLFGFVGVLLAIPVSAVVGVLIRFAMDNYQHSTLYHDE